MEKKDISNENIDKSRRNFLKIALIGGGALVAGKFLSPLFSDLMNGPSTTTNLEHFKTVENKNGLTVFDKSGQEIFVMDDGK